MRGHKNVLIVCILSLSGVIALQALHTPSTESSFRRIKRTVKMVQPLKISITKQEQKSIAAGDIVTLVATIQPSQAIGRVKWEWQGTAGVKVLGPTSGYFDVTGAREEHVVQVRFQQLSNENEMVNLNIYRTDGRNQVAGSFSYHTLNQEKIENEAAEIAERQRIYNEEMENQGMTVLSSEDESSHQHE